MTRLLSEDIWRDPLGSVRQWVVSVGNPYVGSGGDFLVPYPEIPTRTCSGSEETELEGFVMRYNGFVA